MTAYKTGAAAPDTTTHTTPQPTAIRTRDRRCTAWRVFRTQTFWLPKTRHHVARNPGSSAPLDAFAHLFEPAPPLLRCVRRTKDAAMTDYGRRVVVDLPFDTAVGELNRAIREEGLQTIARINVRDHFWRDLGRDFRQYFLLEAWSPDLAFEVLRDALECGPIVPTTFVVYALADGECAVVANEPFELVAAQREWRLHAPALAALADRESERVARVLDRVQHASSHEKVALSAA
jgi:uncharacterized protein (DUF302 family)